MSSEIGFPRMQGEFLATCEIDPYNITMDPFLLCLIDWTEFTSYISRNINDEITRELKNNAANETIL